MTAALLVRNAHRLAALGLAALGFWSMVSGVHAAADLTPAQAEAEVARLLNQQRAAVGAVALRVDSRMTAVARSRSADMATKHYFDHQQPDGRWAWDLMTERGITWYDAGENIAWNDYSTLAESAAYVAQQWRKSAPHYALLTSRNYNYFGIGTAFDTSTGRRYWTAVFLKGPDRTGATARMKTPSIAGTGTKKSITLYWTGADVRLQVLTSGLYTFQLQKRVDGGSWVTRSSATTRTSVTGYMYKGHLYEYRIRARDRAGNYGAWTTPLVVRP